MDRRTFLGAAAAGSVGGAAALAIDGGKPVRSRPLRAGYFGPQYFGDEERQGLQEVLDTRRPFRWYGPGKEPPVKVATFEAEFAARTHARYALGVTSGSAALLTALAALEVGPGDEVILPAFTWYSCYNAVVLSGALPVFAEIDESLNLDAGDFERKVTAQTRAVMVVHLLGTPCDMDRVLAVARRHTVKVLEDCAQALGATYHGKPVGSLGDVGIFSLQINKTITAGEGGVVVTDDPVLFERASRYHDLGGLRPPHEALVGGAKVERFPGNQYRMSEFTGAVSLAQLRKLDTIVRSLKGLSRRVGEGIRHLASLRPRSSADREGDLGSWVFLGFPGKPERDRFVAAMAAENVPAHPPGGSVILPTQPYVERKMAPHPAWPTFQSERGRSIRYGTECCPRTIDILDRYAGVALDPKFSRHDADDVVAAVCKVHPAVV
jgi:8-amino-3,8-dideoxy-alpha-D-manno-octulosonate transaminase